ncbi:MAG: PRTRC system protein E [Bacteroidota bacterium]
METNFFQQIADLQLSGNIRLNIQPQSDNKLLVSLLLTSDQVKDKTAYNIPPLLLNGTPLELDNGFFEAVTKPIQKTNGLLCNLIEHEKGMEKAQKESRVEKDKAEASKKDKEGKRKKFDEQMKKVEELEKLKKIGEAIGQLPDLKLFPEFTEEIKKKSQQLRSQHGTLSLFEEPVSENNPPGETGEDTPEEEENEDNNDEDNFDYDNEPDDYDENNE